MPPLYPRFGGPFICVCVEVRLGSWVVNVRFLYAYHSVTGFESFPLMSTDLPAH